MVVEIHEAVPDDWDEFRRMRLGSLRESPDAFRRVLGDEEEAPAENWRPFLERIADCAPITPNPRQPRDFHRRLYRHSLLTNGSAVLSGGGVGSPEGTVAKTTLCREKMLISATVANDLPLIRTL